MLLGFSGKSRGKAPSEHGGWGVHAFPALTQQLLETVSADSGGICPQGLGRRAPCHELLSDPLSHKRVTGGRPKSHLSCNESATFESASSQGLPRWCWW